MTTPLASKNNSKTHMVFEPLHGFPPAQQLRSFINMMAQTTMLASSHTSLCVFRTTCRFPKKCQ